MKTYWYWLLALINLVDIMANPSGAETNQTTSRRPSIADLKTMNKEPLRKAALDLLAELSKFENAPTLLDEGKEPTLHDVMALLLEIKKDRETFDQYKKDNDAKINRQETRISNLEQENQHLTNSLLQHQRFLESMDAEKRRNTLIITGIPEDEPLHSDADANGIQQPIQSDEDKVQHVLSKIGHGDKPVSSVERLGIKKSETRSDGSAYSRAVKVTLTNPSHQSSLLDLPKNLNMNQNHSKRCMSRRICILESRELNKVLLLRLTKRLFHKD